MPETETMGTGLKYNIDYPKHSGDLTGDIYSPYLITSGRKGTGISFGNTSVNTNVITKPFEAKPSIDNGAKIKCQYYFKGCLDALDRAITNFDEIFSRANALDELNRNLSILWEYRKHREEQFARLINKIQTLLLEVEAEKITLRQLNILLEVLSDAFAKQVFTNEDIKNYLIKFQQSGYDIYKGLR
ncbi:MAG: hypothetical protein QME51_07315 [Planctomycetota bacterium]|nr:hypothetical protein [Planctomycetota bacterium]